MGRVNSRQDPKDNSKIITWFPTYDRLYFYDVPNGELVIKTDTSAQPEDGDLTFSGQV